MSLLGNLKRLFQCVGNLLRYPRQGVRAMSTLPEARRAADFARLWRPAAGTQPCDPPEDAVNPLRAYFDGVKEGPGLWKWLHYFEIYHRHLQKFVGRKVTVVEVGIFSGGSLPMWLQYFGEGCHVHGVDIQPECKAYEGPRTTVHIGDQADRAFWKRFRESVPAADVLIDDGGHQAEQQMVTLEEMLPHLRPGGVYICEDLHGVGNHFAAFARSLADELNRVVWASKPGELVSNATALQAAVHSVHLYPFAVVVERREAPLMRFSSPKHGTHWQPFL